jgi:hypothetical protein
MYGVEMQRKNYDNHQKRVRYVGANIDTYITEKGIEYQNLWNVHMVYISEFDVFHGKKTIYHISRTIDELQKKAYNGFDEIYVNTKIHDGSLLAELMEIFKSSKVPNHPKFPRISNAIRYYKEGKGREEMCKIMEEFAKEQQALGRESGREEMREEMQVKMRRYGKKQRHTGRRQGRNEGRREGREELVSVITLLRSGKDKEEIRHMGYDEATINDAIMVL